MFKRGYVEVPDDIESSRTFHNVMQHTELRDERVYVVELTKESFSCAGERFQFLYQRKLRRKHIPKPSACILCRRFKRPEYFVWSLVGTGFAIYPGTLSLNAPRNGKTVSIVLTQFPSRILLNPVDMKKPFNCEKFCLDEKST